MLYVNNRRHILCSAPPPPPEDRDSSAATSVFHLFGGGRYFLVFNSNSLLVIPLNRCAVCKKMQLALYRLCVCVCVCVGVWNCHCVNASIGISLGHLKRPMVEVYMRCREESSHCRSAQQDTVPPFVGSAALFAGSAGVPPLRGVCCCASPATGSPGVAS